MHLISLITINRNNVNGLKKTFDSIYSQTCKDFEYIIVDGGSTDGGIETIQKFDSSIIRLTWISEPDLGIYNAMNKGIRMATGEFLLFLNSGDWLAADNVVENVLPHLNNDFEIISGELELIKSNNEKIKLFPPAFVNLNYCISSGLTHPNTFIKKALFEKYGYYNEQNKIISDWEFFLIVCGLNRCNYKSIPVLVSCFAMDGVSSNNENILKQETKAALQRLLPWWKKLERLIRHKC